MTERAAKAKSSAGDSTAAGEGTSSGLSLQEIQALFQEAILNQDDRVLALLLDNSRTTRDTLFGVYRNGYAGRLVDILASDYEDVQAYLGADEFDELARAYVAANPSRSQNARWFGDRMPEFLVRDDRYSGRPELTDLASIERALSNAFDAEDAPHISLQDLARFKPEDWGRLTFVPHPAAVLFEVASNAFSIWTAIRSGDPLPTVETGLCQRLVVWRQGMTPMIREMSAEEAMMWTEACRGLKFEAQCEMVAAFDDPDGAALRAAGYLQGWSTTEMLTSARLAPRSATAPKRLARQGQKSA